MKRQLIIDNIFNNLKEIMDYIPFKSFDNWVDEKGNKEKI